MENFLAGLFGMIIGIGGMLTAIFQLRNVRSLKTWKTTSGKIIERGTFRITHATRSAPAFQHSPLVKYVYYVDGEEFTSDSIAPKHIELPKHNTVEWAQKRADAFPENPAVYYNPENSADSFLVLSATKKVFYFIFGISLLIFSVSLIYLILR